MNKQRNHEAMKLICNLMEMQSGMEDMFLKFQTTGTDQRLLNEKFPSNFWIIIRDLELYQVCAFKRNVFLTFTIYQ